jgi:hypothetical protein
MQCRVLLIMLILVAACGDSGPETDRFTGLWRLTSVNTQPLPSAGNATAGEVWVAGVLQIEQGSGFFDRCLEAPSTSTRISRTTALLVAPISEDKIEVSYFERRDIVPDTAALNGEQLTLRYRNIIGGQVQGLDVLTFVPLTGALPPACSLAP